MTAPKAPSSRRRRNVVKTSTLHVVDPSTVIIPPLPDRRPWHELTAVWWETVHTSPMASEFVEADLFNLYHLAELMDDFWLAGSPKERVELSKEIRIKGQAFGFTPLDRRRLSWEIDKGEQAEIKTRARRNRVVGEAEADKDIYAALR